jgi:multiple sugar transport system substrate-binding protein
MVSTKTFKRKGGFSMGKYQKPMMLVASSALMVGAMAGCGSAANAPASNASNNTTPSTSGSGSPVTVTLMTWENPQTNGEIMKSLQNFMNQNPDIKVKLLNAPLQDYGTKVNSMLAAGQAADIFELGNDMEQQWGQQGLLYDYASLATQDSNFLSNFVPAAVTNWERNGKLYGLPSLMNTYGVFYNKAAFKAAGLPLPKPGWTYQEMFNDAQKLASDQGGVHSYGLYDQNTYTSPFGLSVYAASAGGAPFLDSATNASKITASPQFVDGLHLYQKYIKNGSVTPPTWDGSQGESLFLAGKLPMWVGGQWYMEQMLGPSAPKNLDWGFAPNPIVDKQSTIYDAVGWGSPKSIAHPDAVYKVLKYLDTEQYSQTLPGAPVAAPAYKPAATAYYDTLKKDGHQEAVDAIEYMLNSPDQQPVRFMETWANQANQFISADWNNLMEGKAPDSTLQDMVSKLNASINSAP